MGALNDTEHLKNFGENVKKLRKAKALTLRQMAARCAKNHSDISKIERGDINIRFLTILEIAKALDVNPIDLMSFESEATEPSDTETSIGKTN